VWERQLGGDQKKVQMKDDNMCSYFHAKREGLEILAF
jgi:hypothetical protein